MNVIVLTLAKLKSWPAKFQKNNNQYKLNILILQVFALYKTPYLTFQKIIKKIAMIMFLQEYNLFEDSYQQFKYEELC